MSRSIDLFIESDLPAEELAAEVSRLSTFTVRAGSEPGTWILEEGGVSAELSTNHFVDDGDLRLGRYGYSLSSRVPAEKRLADAPETSLLRVVSEALHRGGMGTLLVHDLQYHERLTARPGADPQAQPSEGGQAPVQSAAGAQAEGSPA